MKLALLATEIAPITVTHVHKEILFSYRSPHFCDDIVTLSCYCCSNNYNLDAPEHNENQHVESKSL